jgi:mRNA-degrading endonuclease RelE of RelBE toxin-antitoxin system
MRYEILLAPEAVQDVRSLRASIRAEVRDGLERHLRHQPAEVSRARIKRLEGEGSPEFRLRIGDVRVFYDVRETEVWVVAVVSKAEAEDWLRKAGKVR